MKPLPAPEIQGRTPWDRMDTALRTILKVPKEVILKEEAKEKRKKERNKEQKRG
jgi:hypothetical protein